MDVTAHLPGLRPQAGTDPYLPGHGDRSFDVESYDLDLDYRVEGNRLVGEATLEVVVREETGRLELDLRGLVVDKVVVGGRRPAKFAVRSGRLRIQLAQTAQPGERLVVLVRYSGRPVPVRSRWGEVGWEELTDGVLVAGQPAGAPSWFPCNDRPDDKASYRFRVTTASEYVVVCNGSHVDTRRRASRTTWVFDQAEPMATYLATVQIGRYQQVELAGTSVPQRVLLPARVAGPVLQDVARQPEMMDVFTRLFGPFPFGAYTVVVTADELEIPLEAQSVSVFGVNHLDGSGRLERLVAHELAHQWFGNSLTAGRWSDIWLHEGFACYAEWLWSEWSGGQVADALARRHHRELEAAVQDLVVADPGPELMFDDRLYKRGAIALHSVRLDLGDDRFFAMIREWVSQNRFATVSTEMFEEHLRRHGATDDLLDPWLHQARLPPM